MLGGRQNGKDVKRRKRCMQKESQPTSPPKATECRSQREKMVIVHPDDIRRTQQWEKLAGKRLVDTAIHVIVVTTPLDSAGKAVQQRPQSLITKAAVKGRDLLFSQIHGCKFNWSNGVSVD
jgi:hypothetical protein